MQVVLCLTPYKHDEWLQSETYERNECVFYVTASTKTKNKETKKEAKSKRRIYFVFYRMCTKSNTDELTYMITKKQWRGELKHDDDRKKNHHTAKIQNNLDMNQRQNKTHKSTEPHKINEKRKKEVKYEPIQNIHRTL